MTDIFDADLGRFREPFPEEQVKPEEEKTLQRLMRQTAEQYQNLAEDVKGDLEEDEYLAVLKAGRKAAEKKRREYLAAIRANPVVIISAALTKLGGSKNDATTSAQQDLDRSAKIIASGVAKLKAADKLSGTTGRTTLQCIQALGFQPAICELSLYNFGNSLTRGALGFNFLKELGFLDGLPPEVDSIAKLASAIISTGNTSNRGDGKPYYGGTDSNDKLLTLYNLPSANPALEGFFATVDVERSTDDPYKIRIVANNPARAKIVDLGAKTK